MKTKILLLGYNTNDIEIIQHELTKNKMDFESRMTKNVSDLKDALKNFIPDIILAGYSLLSIDRLTAFNIKKELAPHTPFIFIPKAVEEENSIELTNRTEIDVVQQNNFFTLNDKIEKALKESQEQKIKNKTALELIQSEKRLAKAQQVAHMGSWELDLNSNMVILSDETCRIYDLTLNENRQPFESWLSFIHHEDLNFVLEKVKEARDFLKEFSCYHRIICKNGTIRHIYTESKFEFDSNDKPVTLYGIAKDVTKVKLIEEQMEFDKNNLYALINNTKDLMWSIDRDFKLITSNLPFNNIIMYMSGKPIEKGDNVLALGFPQEQLDRFKGYYERAFSGETFSDIEYTDAPVEFWSEISYSPIRNGDEIIGAACHSRDITERKKTERKQLQSEAGLKEAQAIAHLGNWELNFESGMAVWSEEACRIYGLSPEENKQSYSDWAAFIHPEDLDYVLNATKEAQNTLSDSALNHRIILKDGTIKHIASKSRFEFDQNGKPIGLYGIAHDVTEIKEAEKQLINTLLDLEHRVESRTKELVDKNKSILDSINYAKHIQAGLLCRSTQLSEIFPKSFVLSMPRDIVSGDFFWCYQKRNKKFIVVADCTGHGVPAALLSIIGNGLLTQIIENEHIENPSEILELLDVRLAQAVKGDAQDVKDGMDMTLCVIDTYFNEIYYAGAYNPLYISTEKGSINELRANRHSIGGGIQEVSKKFDTKRFPIIPGQRIYLSSDGYISQFGGQKGKKFMKSKFIKTLEEFQHEPVENQKNILLDVLNEWTGSNEQVDDIMVIGIEL